MADLDSTSGKAPAFQFYPNDFLADANVVVMSMQERGVYITLICYCWQQGSLPAQIERLALLCGLPVATFRKLWPAVAVCFKAQANGERFVHPRLERERRKHRAYRKLQSDKGKLGGRPRKPELSTEKAAAFQAPAPEKSSSIFNLRSSSALSDFRPAAAAPNARSHRPIYTSDRFAVFEWQLDELSKTLGSHFEAFDLHAFFDHLSQQSRESGLVIPKAEVWNWLQAQILAEAKRRKLPIASSAPVRDRAAEQRAQDERILAELQEARRAGR